MFKTTGIILSAIVSVILLLQGCSGASVSQQKAANVTSNPSGATVYANVLELGKTPLRHKLYDAFPASWQNSIYQAQGVLVVKKHGCKDFTLKISDYILSKPIHAELECSSIVSKPEISAPVVAPGMKQVVTPHGGTEKRLQELEALYKKGVITKEEYKSTRERILSEL